MLDFIRCISILQFFYECMELGKSATLHSAYSVHFFLIQVISAKFNTARRTKKIGEKAKRGRDPLVSLTTQPRSGGRVPPPLSLRQNVEQLARATQPPQPHPTCR